MEKIPCGKICIFHLILLLYIAFHLYSISCEGEKNPPDFFFLRFHVLKYTWIPAGPFRTGIEIYGHGCCVALHYDNMGFCAVLDCGIS